MTSLEILPLIIMQENILSIYECLLGSVSRVAEKFSVKFWILFS